LSKEKKEDKIIEKTKIDIDKSKSDSFWKKQEEDKKNQEQTKNNQNIKTNVSTSSIKEKFQNNNQTQNVEPKKFETKKIRHKKI